MCLKCQEQCIVGCKMCGEVFDYNSTTKAYEDSKLSIIVNVCKMCYMYEACSSCGYLCGANPCRWCRWCG